MPHDLKTFTFENHALTFERRPDGEWWSDFKEVSPLLGYSSAKAVERLFARHKAEFLPAETCTVTLTVQGQGRRVRLFSVRGLEHLAILGRTDTCIRFRRWLLDISEQLRTGAARLVTEEQMAAALEKLAATVAARYEAQIAQQGSSIAALARLGEVQASNAGRMLSLLARDPEVRRLIEDERDKRNGVNRLPFPGSDLEPSSSN